MDIKDFKFPKITNLFEQTKTDPELLKEAKCRGFYNGHTPYNKLFSKLFFEGGKIGEFKKDLTVDFKISALSYLKLFMMSFEPKHEEKEAICAMLLSELVEIK